MATGPVFKILDRNLYIDPSEYKQILSNPKILPSILAKYKHPYQTIDINYARGQMDLPGAHLVHKKSFFHIINPDRRTGMYYDSLGKVIDKSRLESRMLGKFLTYIPTQPDYDYWFNLVLITVKEDFGPRMVLVE